MYRVHTVHVVCFSSLEDRDMSCSGRLKESCQYREMPDSCVFIFVFESLSLLLFL